MTNRAAQVIRETKETRIMVELVVDGCGGMFYQDRLWFCGPHAGADGALGEL